MTNKEKLNKIKLSLVLSGFPANIALMDNEIVVYEEGEKQYKDIQDRLEHVHNMKFIERVKSKSGKIIGIFEFKKDN